MNKRFLIIISMLALIFGGTAVQAQTGAGASASQEGRLLLDADNNDTTAKGNVETEFKVEEGESAADGDPDQPVVTGRADMSEEATKESGEKSGTADINIGIGELQESQSPGERVMQPEFGAGAEAGGSQNNQSDLDFINERAHIRVQASEVLGWDPEKKQALALEAKTHAELKSGQDLENFASGILLRENNAVAVEANSDKASVTYDLPAKFLGLFNARLKTTAEVTFGDGEHGRVPERVKVKFPWYRLFYSLHNSLSAEVLQTEIKNEAAASIAIDEDLSAAGRVGATLEAMIEVFRIKGSAAADATGMISTATN